MEKSSPPPNIVSENPLYIFYNDATGRRYTFPREGLRENINHVKQRLSSADINILHKKTAILAILVKKIKIAFLIFSLLFY